MSVDVIESFKIINGNFNYGRYFFTFLPKLEIYYRDGFQKLCQLTNWIFC